MRVAVVGAGPSGLFLGHRLLRLNPDIQLCYYESRPQPYGLVQFGVAPDHPEVKNCTKIFADVLAQASVSCRYGTLVGPWPAKVTLADLLGRYNAVVLATGLSKPKRLFIDRQNLPNYFTSAEFVAWYNGDPSVRLPNVDLHSVKRVAVIGHGNVALDIARILLKPWWAYADTTISDGALRELQRSSVEAVDLIGRRGPLQVSFTRAELKEILGLQGVTFQTNLDVVRAELDRCRTLLSGDRPRRRLLELLESERWQARASGPKALSLDFYSSPKEVVGSSSVSGLWLERTRPLVENYSSMDDLKDARVEGSGVLECRPYQLIVSSTGFENHCSFGLPTCGPNGPIRNADGQVAGFQNLFVTGWAATGAVGDLSSAMRQSYAVADLIYHVLSGPTLKT